MPLQLSLLQFLYNLKLQNMLESGIETKQENQVTHCSLITQLTSKVTKNSTNLIFHYLSNTFKNKTSFYTILIQIFPQLFILLQLAIIVLASRNFLTTQNITSFVRSLFSQFYIIQIIIRLIIILKITSIVVALIATAKSHFIYFLNIKFICKTIILTKFVFVFTSFLISIDLCSNLDLFLGSSILIFVETTLFTNSINRKNITFVASSKNFLFLSFITILNILLNASYLNDENRYISFSIIILAIISLVWHIKSGHLIYRHQLAKLVLFFITCTYTSFIIIFGVSLLNPKIISLTSLEIQLLLSFGVIMFFLRNITQKELSFQQHKPSYSSLRDFEIQLFQNIEQNPLSSKQNKVMLMGLLKIHEQKHCGNINCYTKIKQLYDPYTYQVFDPQEKNKSLQLRSRLLVKCLYEQKFEDLYVKQKKFVDYLQFTYNQLNNEWITYQMYYRLQNSSLNFFDRIKVQTIFLLTKQKRQLFNSKLFDSKIKIQNIFQSQKVFNQVFTTIKTYLRGQFQVIQYLRNETINVFDLKIKIKQVLAMIDAMQEKWKFLEEHLNRNRYWSFVHLIYHLFIKNQRLTRPVIERFTQAQASNPIKDSIPFHLFEREGHAKCINEKIVYHFQSLSILANQQKGQLIIKNISNSAEDLLGYVKEVLIGMPVSVLMSDQLKNTHDEKMKQWLSLGHLTNQSDYNVRFTKVVKENGSQEEVVKYFKIYVGIDNDLEYVCLLKMNEKIQLQVQNTNQLHYDVPLVSHHESPLTESLNESVYENLKQEKINNINFILSANDNQKNIFLKNQRLKITKEFKEFTYIKILFRILIITVLLFLIFTALTTNNSLDSTILYSNNYFNFMTIYRIPVLLTMNYYKIILNIGNQKAIKTQINSLTNQFINLANTSQVKNTIFDQNLNKKFKYYPFNNNSVLNNQKQMLDEIDLFYKIQSNILTLNSLSIDLNSQEFINLNSLLIPSYSNMMNSTKLAFHSQFQNIFTGLKDSLQYMMISFIAVMVVYFIILSFVLNKLFKTVECVMKALIEVKAQYLDKIESYIMRILDQYKGLEDKSNQTFTHKNKLQKSKQYKREANLNNKLKEIDWQKQTKKINIFYYSIIISMLLFLCTLILIPKLMAIQSVQGLQSFQEDQFKILNCFPSSAIVGVGFVQKYFSQQQNITFYPQKYLNVLSTMQLYGSFQYQANQQSQLSPFYQKWEIYYFSSNLCNYNPKVYTSIGFTTTDCLTIFNRQFQNGLNNFFRTLYKLSQDYLLGRIGLSLDKINQFASVVTFSSSFVIDLLLSWSNEYAIRVSAIQSQIIESLVISILLLLAFHVIVIQVIVFSKLKKENHLIKQIYNRFIPEFLLIKQKILAKQLENHNVFQG